MIDSLILSATSRLAIFSVCQAVLVAGSSTLDRVEFYERASLDEPGSECCSILCEARGDFAAAAAVTHHESSAFLIAKLEFAVLHVKFSPADPATTTTESSRHEKKNLETESSRMSRNLSRHGKNSRSLLSGT